MANLHTPDQLHSRTAYIGAGVVGLLLAFLIVTRAFDTASMWQYATALVLLGVGIHLIWRGIFVRKK